jgi:GTP-binding protein EngB required for normal cell division
MNPTAPNASKALNEFQKRRLLVTCEHIDKMLSEVESVLSQASSKTVFPKFRAEVIPAQKRTIENYIARIRAQLLRVLDGQDIPRKKPSIDARHSIHVSLTFIEIAVEELYPKYMQGYGLVPESAAVDLNGIAGELLGLVAKLDRYVADDEGEDLKQRLERLEQTGDEMQLLRRIEQVVTDRGLVEFRCTIADILDRAEDKSFEIAVFGRVSSGKSSLLNAVLETDVLPIGVTPVTAVPTRITYGERPALMVWFAERPPQTIDMSQLSEFVTEQKNPGNTKHVTRVVVQQPAARLHNGVTFVDTPGLGSLATRGAVETLAYLPKCDLGVVLIDAGSTLTPDDLQTIEALVEATVPVMVLLSKSDLLTELDQERVVAYVKEHIATECKCDMSVQPVSALPSHRALLDRWFENEIQPLYAHCQDLRSASLKRKVGALRESVAASLKVSLRKTAGETALSPEQLREVEARLRVATGKLEALWEGTEPELERVFGDLRGPLEKASAAVVAFWSEESTPEVTVGVVARSAMVESIQERVHAWKERVNTLAFDLSADLRSSALALEISDMPTESEFLSLVRDLPVFDPPTIDLHIARPSAALLLGKRFAQGQIARALESQVRAPFTAAMDTYTGMLKQWTERVLRQFKGHFDSYADGYRAQAERILGGHALSTEEEAQIHQDLQLLGAEDIDSRSVVQMSERSNIVEERQPETEADANWRRF